MATASLALAQNGAGLDNARARIENHSRRHAKVIEPLEHALPDLLLKSGRLGVTRRAAIHALDGDDTDEIRGRQAAANPWGASTLEWQVSSPPPEHNFDELPVIQEGPYEYGVPGAA